MARSIRASKIADKYGNLWQYHSRSDRHSKIACWAIMFDLMLHCPLLREHAEKGKIGFGINHEMRVFRTNKKKKLDLVICTPRADFKTTAAKKRISFADHAQACGIVLTESEEAVLHKLPNIFIVPVGTVQVALEAKAAMTAHQKARPRLHDELDSSHSTVHGATDHAIAAGLVMINVAARFLSSDNNKRSLADDAPTWNIANQPYWTEETIETIREIPRRTRSGEHGFDAVGIIVVNFRNDGSEVLISNNPPAPGSGDADHYASMIDRISSLYASRFASF